MADVHNCGALFLEASNDVVKYVHFVFGERTRGFVEHDYLRSKGNTARNRDHLSKGDVQTAECCAWIDFEAETFQQCAGVGIHAFPVDKTESSRLAAEINVFGDGTKCEQVYLLVN